MRRLFFFCFIAANLNIAASAAYSGGQGNAVSLLSGLPPAIQLWKRRRGTDSTDSDSDVEHDDDISSEPTPSQTSPSTSTSTSTPESDDNESATAHDMCPNANGLKSIGSSTVYQDQRPECAQYKNFETYSCPTVYITSGSCEPATYYGGAFYAGGTITRQFYPADFDPQSKPYGAAYTNGNCTDGGSPCVPFPDASLTQSELQSLFPGSWSRASAWLFDFSGAVNASVKSSEDSNDGVKLGIVCICVNRAACSCVPNTKERYLGDIVEGLTLDQPAPNPRVIRISSYKEKQVIAINGTVPDCQTTLDCDGSWSSRLQVNALGLFMTLCATTTFIYVV